MPAPKQRPLQDARPDPALPPELPPPRRGRRPASARPAKHEVDRPVADPREQRGQLQGLQEDEGPLAGSLAEVDRDRGRHACLRQGERRTGHSHQMAGQDEARGREVSRGGAGCDQLAGCGRHEGPQEHVLFGIFH